MKILLLFQKKKISIKKSKYYLFILFKIKINYLLKFIILYLEHKIIYNHLKWDTTTLFLTLSIIKIGKKKSKPGLIKQAEKEEED